MVLYLDKLRQKQHQGLVNLFNVLNYHFKFGLLLSSVFLSYVDAVGLVHFILYEFFIRDFINTILEVVATTLGSLVARTSEEVGRTSVEDRYYVVFRMHKVYPLFRRRKRTLVGG